MSRIQMMKAQTDEIARKEAGRAFRQADLDAMCWASVDLDVAPGDGL